jgi:aryl-alcohol dehydrogenase-like predicted oxidoreductase
MIGRATPEHTAGYATRMADAAPGHFRRAHGQLVVSSIGLGTFAYQLDGSDEMLARHIETIHRILAGGVNVIDTASNYGAGTAESVIGAALSSAFRNGLRREEVVVTTKGGYLPFEVRQFDEEFVRTGRCTRSDLAPGEHCIAPAFIREQIERSRARLGLDTIDVYFLHNPEDQMPNVSRADFARRMRRAFAVLEEAAALGRIACYGVAAAEGFFGEEDSPHRLDHLLALAHEVAPGRHQFKVIQLPLSVVRREALFLENHALNGAPASVLAVAQAHGLMVMTSVSIQRGRLPRPLPRILHATCPGASVDIQRALQFTRSAPGVHVALVGMSCRKHVDENLWLRRIPPADLTADYVDPPGPEDVCRRADRGR